MFLRKPRQSHLFNKRSKGCVLCGEEGSDDLDLCSSLLFLSSGFSFSKLSFIGAA